VTKNYKKLHYGKQELKNQKINNFHHDATYAPYILFMNKLGIKSHIENCWMPRRIMVDSLNLEYNHTNDQINKPPAKRVLYFSIKFRCVRIIRLFAIRTRLFAKRM